MPSLREMPEALLLRFPAERKNCRPFLYMPWANIRKETESFMYQKICYQCFKEKGDYQVCPHCGYIEGTRPEQDYYLIPGTMLADRYLIGVKIGVGGFGIVYKAFDMLEDKIVAVKEFYPARMVNRMPGESTINIFTGSQMDEYQNLRSQFEMEARFMEHFRGEPDIVNLKEYLEINGTAYIIMEYIDGILLREYLKLNGPMEERDAVQITLHLLHILEKIHQKGIIHRDISPDNIFLLENNGMKLFDFGSAQQETRKKEKRMGKTNALVKPGYTPPEQYGAQNPSTPQMDVYAVGATLHEMLTGKRPPEGSARAVKEELLAPSKCGVSVSEAVDRIVMRAMAVRPQMRFSTAEEFAQALTKNKVVELPETEWARKQYRRRLITGMAICLSAICVFAVVGVSTYISMNNLTNVKLKEDTLHVWVPIDQEGSMEAMTQIWVREYQKKYPMIQLELVSIPEEEYSQRLLEAKMAGQMPDVFSTRDYQGDVKEDCASLKPLIHSLDAQKCLFFEDYREYYPEMLQLPVGFQVGVLYENSQRMQEGDTQAELSELRKEGGATLAWADDRDMQGVYAEFAKAKTPLSGIAGDLSILKRVESQTSEKVPAREYNVLPITQEGKLLGMFTDTWAVRKDCTKNQKNAGMLLLSYLTEEVLQEEAYLASYDSIPVNKAAYETYKEYKMTEKLSFLEAYEDNMSISAQGDNLVEAYLEMEK